MTGTNFYTIMPEQSANHYSGLVDENGYVLLGKFDTVSTPDTTAGVFQAGCIMAKTDASGALFENVGTLASPSWSIIDAGAAGITQLHGDVTAGPGTGNQAATVVAIQGIKINSLIAGIFTNEVLQYSGNTAVGMVPSSLKAGTAVAGAVSFTSTQYGTNTLITTEALSTAAGATYSLTVTDGQLTSTSNYIGVTAYYNSATAGQLKLQSITKTGGSATFVFKNIDPTLAANGTFFISYFAI